MSVGSGQRYSFSARTNTLMKLHRAICKSAPLLNPVDQPILTTQPTITTTADGTLTTLFSMTASQAGAGYFNLLGGVPYLEYASVGGAGQDAWTVNPANYGGTKYTGQAIVEFYSDAPKVQLNVSQGTFRIEVNGQFISKTGNAASSGGGQQYMGISWGGVRATRLYRVHMSPGLYFVTAAVDALSRVWAPSMDDVVTCLGYGDSFVQGTGSSYPDNNFFDVACAELGFTNPIHCAFGGTGFVNAGAYTNYIGHISDAVGLNPAPDCILVEGGRNDLTYSQSTVQAATLAFLQAMRGYYSNAPIFVIGIWGGNLNSSAALVQTETAVSSAVTQFGDPFCKFIPVTNDATGSWVYGTGYQGATNGSGNSDNYVYTDAEHPNDNGHDYFGRRSARGIRDVIRQLVTANGAG